MKKVMIKGLSLGLLLASAFEGRAATYMRQPKYKHPGCENWSRSKYSPHYGKNAAARNLAGRCN